MFSNFRSDPVYNEILEHVSREQGAEYLKIIPSSEHFDEFRKNDLYGGPRVFNYPEVGDFSPTTLRYIKVLYDIEKFFGNLDGAKVFEIGVGYGGQCRLCCKYFDLKEYVLLDLPQVLRLAERYLMLYPLKPKLTFKTINECSRGKKIDLVISNYAFTEISRDIQDVYIKKIIKKSKRGYITYSDISGDLNSYKKQELLSIIPGSAEYPEEPATHPGNCIIAWGTARR
jgi:putative sugar O-methyltransferase